MAAVPYGTAWAFVLGKKAHNGNFHTDGTTIYTYGVALAVHQTKPEPHILVFKSMGRSYSLTSSRHQRALRFVLEKAVKGIKVVYEE